MKLRYVYFVLFLCFMVFACRTGREKGAAGKAIVLGDFEFTAEHWGPSDAQLEQFGQRLLEHPQLLKALTSGDRRLLSFHVVDPERKDDDRDPAPTRFQATFYDYASERTVDVRGDLALREQLQIEVSSTQLPPTEEEFREAVSILEDEPRIGPMLRSGAIVAYLAMPGVSEAEEIDGSRRRWIIVGFLPKGSVSGVLPEAVAESPLYGVSLGRRAVMALDAAQLGFTLSHGEVCEPPNSAGQTTTPRWTSGSAKITVKQGGKTIWTFRVTRPSKSSGTRGSGVELCSVKYKGTTVLARAHVPILNVHYQGNACGPYRDWQYQEDAFEANGTNVTAGIRICPTPARTIIESGSDQGNFRGVAIWVEGQEVVLASELQAGWYRYVSRWRLHSNGTIRPQFGFAATANYCTCKRHFHNCYWRLDFDIAGAGGDRIEEFNDPPITSSSWHTKTYEHMRHRDAGRQRRWRVRDGARSYTLVPGTNDGTADAYARGDVWFLRYRGSGEYDDGHNSTGSNTEADISKFDNNEYIVDKDVVLWYSAHFDHGAAHSHATGVYLGPVLQPSGF